MSPQLVQALVLIVLGYLVGSLPVGVMVARATGGVDPRSVGSGRTGGTNA
ncbi:MAG: glycerol-3-phosphate acyltransferase, partial [Chloroflexi bacterium]|nr:glycerol-3-phosphate acyltransferase [Chloroflexota bacterium]